MADILVFRSAPQNKLDRQRYCFLLSIGEFGSVVADKKKLKISRQSEVILVF